MFGLLYDLDTNTISERNQCCSAGYSMFFLSEAYSESCQTSKMERFAKIVNGF